MISSFFFTTLYQPLYNGLIFLIDIIPYRDAGLAVVSLTIIVKLILFPLSKKAVRTQLILKQVQPEVDSLKEKHKDDKQAQAQAMMGLYKEKGINPFSSFFLILIQLPIILTLYRIFVGSGLPEVNTDILYYFVPTPETVDTIFLGFIDIGSRSVLLAVAAAVTSFFQIRYSVPPHQTKEGAAGTFKDDLARSMNVQMRYVFPAIVLFIAYGISGAVALYWTTSNLFMIAQELYMRKRVKPLLEKSE